MSKRRFLRLQNSADNLNFPQKYCLRTRAVSRITQFAELLTVISPNYVQPLLDLSVKTSKYILNKNATLIPNSHDFYDFCTSVAIFALFSQIC